ncbi:MAG: hypothetical protein EOP23_15155 [Hyphomicrobiales bacterium]|nr:MAG: hypothetical protein EOP23_15155 [Hyphomicrobiales bacterium]
MTASASAEPQLLPLPDARAHSADGAAPPLAVLVEWVETYLMSPHADLGRTGAVCPFTRQAAKLDTVRLGISASTAGDEEAAFAAVRRSFADLDAIPAQASLQHFRTVILGFPGCADPAGTAMLQRVQKRLKFASLRRLRMIGLMHPASEAPGLWNPQFRPLRAPFPVVAVRHMVEHDAPFAARHPLLMLPYLARFRIAGAKRLIAHLRAGP